MDRRRNRAKVTERTEDAQEEQVVTVAFTRLSPHELRELKENLLNIVAAALIQQPRMSVSDPTMQKITLMVKKIAFYDPEFVLKLAMYVRLDLNIRSTANYLLALACNIPECQPYFKKYYVHTVRLPSDWLDVAATYHLLPDRQLKNKSLPTCLRKAMVEKFPEFDAYQLGKYNKERSIKRKLKKLREEKASNPNSRKFKGGDQKPMLTIKQMIRQLHIASPNYNIMCLLGKKYPMNERQFQESNLSGQYEHERAGRRMKLPVPETWETLLSEKGNKASTWEELIEHKKLPFMAMLRNLRNMIYTGVHPRYHRWVQNKLSDPRAVASSKQFPFQFFSAYEVIPRDMQHFKELMAGDKDKDKDKKGDKKGGDKKPGQAAAEQVRRKRKKPIVPAHMPTDKIFEDYRKAIDNSVKLATIHNVAPIRGTTVVFCNVGKETRESAPGAKGMGSGVRKIQEVGYLLGLMCKYVCEECDFRIYSSSSPTHPETSHVAVDLIEGTILDNMKVVAEKAKELGDTSEFPFDYLEAMIRDKLRVDNFMVLSHRSINPDEDGGDGRLANLLNKYRSEVNADMLFVSVDLSGSGKSAIGSNNKHPNDISITGFSDQILRFIAERGDQNQLQYVEHIDEAKDVDKKAREKAAANPPAFEVSPWWRWLDSLGTEQQPIRYPNIVVGPKWRSARVFISSTFLDMHGERDILTRIVFPEIKERAKQRKLEVFEVDLRWGVTEEESQQGKSIQLCLDEVERCTPFFIGMLGDRYGWAPENWNDVPQHSRFDWVRNYPTGRSITELEMQLALRKADNGTFFYFRDGDFISTMPEQHSKFFLGRSAEENDKMNELKHVVSQSGYPVHHYSASYGGEADGKPIVTGLDSFAERVFNDLWSALDSRFPPENPSSDPLELERSYHQALVQSLTGTFIGRKELLDQMQRFVSSSRGTLMVVTGKPGDGKSSLLANFAKQLADTDEKTFVLPHFIGASPGSTDIRKTLFRICTELKHVFSLDEVPEIPDDFKELTNLLPVILEQAAFKGKLVIIIDAINQLDDKLHKSHSLDWLPDKLPCKFIISTLTDNTCYAALQHKYSIGKSEHVSELKVTPLDVRERTEIVRATLWQYHKKLDERPMNNQMRVLLRKTDAGSPLYLAVACEELRVFGVYEAVSDRIKSMGPTTARLFDEVLVRLETDHGRNLVQDACALMAVSRSGMLESELKSMLQVQEYTWQGFLRSLSAFLKPTGDRGEMSFFHQQFEHAVEKRYLPNQRTVAKYQSKLATYFYDRIDPDRSGTWSRGSDARAVRELPHHLIAAEDWESVVRVLGDLMFVELKITLGQTFDLISDYNEATAESVDGRQGGVGNYDGKKVVREFKTFVQANAYVLQRNPALTFQQAANQPDHTTPAKQALQRWRDGTHSRPWIKWVNKPLEADYCRMTFSGYQESLTASAFSDDGKMIAAASRDCTIRLYNAETGTELTSLTGHSNWIVDLKFSPEGGRLASASWDGTAKVWDTRGMLIATLSDHDRRVNSVAYSKDGHFLATASWDCTIKVWGARDFDSQQEPRPIKTINAGTRPVNSCAFTPDDKHILAGTWDGKISQYNIETGEATLRFAEAEGHTKSVQSIACAPSGKHLVSGSLDRRLILWDAQAGKAITTLTKHAKPLTSVAYSYDGSHVVSASADATTKVWDANLGRERRRIKIENGYMNCVAFSPKSEARLVTGSSECHVGVWDLAENKEILQMTGHTRPVVAVEYDPEAKMIASGSEDGTLIIWNAETGALLHHLKGHNGPVSNLNWSPVAGENRLASCSDDFTIRIWNSDNGTETSMLTGHTSVVRAVAFDARGKLLASASRDNTLRIWDSRNGNQLHLLRGHLDWLNCVDFAPNGSKIVTGSWDYTLGLWNVRKAEQSAIMKGHNSAIAQCKFAPDSKTVISASFDGTMKIWDSDTGTEITTLAGHTSRVNGISISKDGKYLASVSDDQTIKIWDPLAATEVATLVGHASAVRSAAFSPTTKQVVTTSDDKTMKVWDVQIGENQGGSDSESSFSFSSFSSSTEKEKLPKAESGNLQGHSGWINDVRMSADGSRLISVSDDSTLGYWDLQSLQKVQTVRRKETEQSFKACDLDSAGNLAVTASDDGCIILWDLRARKKAADIAKHQGPATASSFSADGFTVVSAGWDKNVFVTDRRNTGSKRTLSGHTDWVLSAAISPDGQSVVSSGWDNMIHLWSTSGAVRSKLTGVHTHTVTCVGFSPDNRLFASSSYDSSVKVWTSTTGKLEHLLSGHHGHVNKLAFSPKIDNCLVTAGSDHTVKLWDMARGEFKNEFVCQGAATAVHVTRAKNELLMAFGDSIGNLYFTKMLDSQ